MATKAKTLDCVEMKNRIQAEILAEYKARKDEFESFGDSIRSSASQSQLAKDVRAKIARAKAKRC